ncbi:MAG: hypothetical protein ACRDS9_27495 [Pseudonocardiaceae bacterium]
MADGENTHQARDAQQGNGRVAPGEGLPEGVFHLLTADGDVASAYWSLVAVCGEPVSTSDLPPSCYPPEGESDRDALYCPACVRVAARFSADGDCASKAASPREDCDGTSAT